MHGEIIEANAKALEDVETLRCQDPTDKDMFRYVTEKAWNV